MKCTTFFSSKVKSQPVKDFPPKFKPKVSQLRVFLLSLSQKSANQLKKHPLSLSQKGNFIIPTGYTCHINLQKNVDPQNDFPAASYFLHFVVQYIF